MKYQQCYRCSDAHENSDACRKEWFCFLCDGKHSPSSKDCPRWRFEKEIVETADVERISIGNAKRQIMGANRSENSTYAQVITKMKHAKRREAVYETNAAKGHIPHVNGLPPKPTNKEDSVPHESSSPKRPSNPGETHVEAHNIAQQSLASPSSKSEVSVPEAKSSKELSLPEKPEEGLVLPEKSKMKSLEGFWSPPRNKRGRNSPPHRLEINTLNRFRVLDPFGPLSEPRPMKKMALSTSCSELDKMETLESNQFKHPRETSMESLKGSANVGAIVGEDISPSPVIGAAGRTTAAHQPQKVKAAETRVKETASTPATTLEKKKSMSHQKSKPYSHSRASSGNHGKQSGNKPAKLNRPSNSKNSLSLSNQGKAGSSTQRSK